jgi:Fe-S cluster assembly iron-binding protein IscA
LALDEPNEKDETFEFDTLKFVVEKDLLDKTGGIKIVFTTNAFGAGFKVESVNPLSEGAGGNTCGTCSC